jgi:hypothetical protein
MVVKKMDVSEQLTVIASAISEGINYLAHIRSLHTKSHVTSSEELLEWCKALDGLQSGLKTFQDGHIGEHLLEGSPPVSSDLILCVDNIRAQLATVTPGTRLPTSLFYLIDEAWAEWIKDTHES